MGLLTLGIAQETSRPEVPDEIKAPDGAELVLLAHATGFQVYTCQLGADGQPAWIFKEPEAELRDKEDRVMKTGSITSSPRSNPILNSRTPNAKR
jgi:hypothetical protein